MSHAHMYATVVSELSQVASVVVEKQKIMGGDGFMVQYILPATILATP